MAAVARRYFVICLISFLLALSSHQSQYRLLGSQLLALLPWRHFPPKTMYQVYLALLSVPNSVFTVLKPP